MGKPVVDSLPGNAVPWGRLMESRTTQLENTVERINSTLGGMQSSVDKTVYTSYDYGMNIANGVNGKLAFDGPTDVQFVSSTGLFEVTVTLAGLVTYGAVLGAGFEAEEFPYSTYFDIPSNGVVASCSPTDTRWVPFAGSRSTVVSTRPGVYNFNLYLHAVTNQNASSVAFVNKAQISIKAV